MKKAVPPPSKSAAPAKPSLQKKEAAPAQSKPQASSKAQPLPVKPKAPKADPPHAQIKAQAPVGKQVKAAPKKEEEVKKEEAKKEDPPSKSYKILKISLTEADNTLKDIHGRDKTAIVFDKTENLATFLKYKGSQADYTEFSILEKMGKKTKEQFIEQTRQMIYASMKIGHTFAFFLDKAVINLSELYKNSNFYVVPEFFIPSKLENREFFAKKILKLEEDVDSFGNKECFKVKEHFNVCILINGDNVEEVLGNIGIPSDLLEVVIIEK